MPEPTHCPICGTEYYVDEFGITHYQGCLECDATACWECRLKHWPVNHLCDKCAIDNPRVVNGRLVHPT